MTKITKIFYTFSCIIFRVIKSNASNGNYEVGVVSFKLKINRNKVGLATNWNHNLTNTSKEVKGIMECCAKLDSEKIDISLALVTISKLGIY